MYAGNFVFSQLIAHLPMHTFWRCVQRYRGHHKVKAFSCLDQFLCLAFAQLTYRESLRDVDSLENRHEYSPCCCRARGGARRPGHALAGPVSRSA